VGAGCIAQRAQVDCIIDRYWVGDVHDTFAVGI
jgi:hypothetical protein